MSNNRYIKAFARLQQAIPNIAAKYQKSKLWFYLDAAKCFVRYGVTPNEYLGWRFYELSGFERKGFYTARDSNKWERKFNTPEYADYFNLKELTNKAFSKFISRDWILTSGRDQRFYKPS